MSLFRNVFNYPTISQFHSSVYQTVFVEWNASRSRIFQSCIHELVCPGGCDERLNYFVVWNGASAPQRRFNQPERQTYEMYQCHEVASPPALDSGILNIFQTLHKITWLDRRIFST